MTKKKKKKKTSSKKTPKGRPGRIKGGANKSDFIRSLPKDMPAKAVVEAGAKKGLKFSQQLVYNVRAAARPEGARKNGKRVGRPRKGGPGRRLPDDASAQFRRLVVDLGVARARELLDGVEAKLRDVVAG